jgi:hypothetical protein
MNVTVDDVKQYLNIIKLVINYTLNFNDTQLYEYFQKCEYEYIINAQDNFAQIVHKLCPRKYHNDMINNILSDVNKFTISSLFICTNCKVHLNILQQKDLHKTKVEQTCNFCSSKVKYEDVAMRAFVKRNIVLHNPILCVDAIKLIDCFDIDECNNILAKELNISKSTKKYQELKNRVKSLISHYSKCISCTSKDLIEGMYLQHKFILKVFSNIDHYSNENIIKKSISRYEKFIKLISENKERSFVPTIDIDIVWHAHQLDTERYKNYCININEYLINHDDMIESDTLDESYRITYDAWKIRYGEKYSTKKPKRTLEQQLYNYYFQYIPNDLNKKTTQYDCSSDCAQFTNYLLYQSITNDYHDSSHNCGSHDCSSQCGSCGND